MTFITDSSVWVLARGSWPIPATCKKPEILRPDVLPLRISTSLAASVCSRRHLVLQESANQWALISCYMFINTCARTRRRRHPTPKLCSLRLKASARVKLESRALLVLQTRTTHSTGLRSQIWGCSRHFGSLSGPNGRQTPPSASRS